MNLRRQEYWRSGLLLLARCIKPLCHLSPRCLCYPFAPLQKHPYSEAFLLVMFSASKEGGSRGGTSLFFRAGTPSYTHYIRRSSPVLLSLFTSARPQSNTSLYQTCIRGGLPLFSENLRRPLLGNRAFGVGRSRKAGTGFCKGRQEIFRYSERLC